MLLFLCLLLASYVQDSNTSNPTGTGFIALKAGWNRMAADGCIRIKAVGCMARTRVRNIVTERRGGKWCCGEGRGLMEVELKELAGTEVRGPLRFPRTTRRRAASTSPLASHSCCAQLPPHHHSSHPATAMSDSEERETKPFKFVTSELPVPRSCSATLS